MLLENFMKRSYRELSDQASQIMYDTTFRDEYYGAVFEVCVY